jgi:spore coat protein U-like protein
MSRGRAGSFNRALFNNWERLNYNLYLDPTRRIVWGDGSGGTEYYSVSNPPNNTTVVVPVYGRINPLQDVSAGTYSDVIEVKILF